MKTIWHVLFFFVLLIFFSHYVWAHSDISSDVGVGMGYGILGSVLARTEEAACRSLINFNHARGDFGEAVMDRVLGSRRGGGWQPISLSSSPQGIDGIYLRRGRDGRPISLLVGEAKFGTSRLSNTKDGRQLSPLWTQKRLAYEAFRYISAGSSKLISIAPIPSVTTERLDVVKSNLPDGREIFFWRSGRQSEWFYAGPKGTLESAQKAILRDGQYIQAAADGRITYRKRLFVINVKNDTITVNIEDVKASQIGHIPLKEIDRFKIDTGSRKTYLKVFRAEMERQLLIKNPSFSQEEAKLIVLSATNKLKHLEELTHWQNRPYYLSALKDISRVGLSAGLVGVATAGLTGLLSNDGQIDLTELMRSSLLGAGSAIVGASIHHVIISSYTRNANSTKFFEYTAKRLGLGTGLTAARVIGQSTSSLAGELTYNLGLWLTGKISGDDVAANIAIGTTGVAAGCASSYGLMAIATAYGTTSTGVAISSISGAAARTAALSWLGGGSIAAGGGGVALGSLVVTGVGIVVPIIVTTSIRYGLEWYSDSKINYRYKLMSDYFLASEAQLMKICRRSFYAEFNL